MKNLREFFLDCLALEEDPYGPCSFTSLEMNSKRVLHSFQLVVLLTVKGFEKGLKETEVWYI